MTCIPICDNNSSDFLLDGYNWTAVENDSIFAESISSGKEQVARRYAPVQTVQTMKSDYFPGTAGLIDICQVAGNHMLLSRESFQLDSHHFVLQAVSNPLDKGSMGALELSGTKLLPSVNTRVFVHDLNVQV